MRFQKILNLAFAENVTCLSQKLVNPLLNLSSSSQVRPHIARVRVRMHFRNSYLAIWYPLYNKYRFVQGQPLGINTK